MIYRFPYENVVYMFFFTLNCLLVKNFLVSMDTPKIQTNNYLRMHICDRQNNGSSKMSTSYKVMNLK